MTIRIAATALLLALAAASCADTVSRSVAQGPRGTWDQAGIDSYTMTVERLCFCPDAGPYLVTVVDGEVASVTHEGKDLDLLDETFQGWPLTVEDLFAEVADAERTADDVVVSYDPELGYPTKIAIDRWENAIDDEVTYVARDLQVAA